MAAGRLLRLLHQGEGAPPPESDGGRAAPPRAEEANHVLRAGYGPADHRGTADARTAGRLFTLLYGTAIEISTALKLTRADASLGTREIRAPGAKAHKRYRVSIVADWAWPSLEAYVKPMLPAAKLFPEHLREDEASHRHLKTVRDLKLRPQVTMHGARHHWAVMRLRAGTPIAVVQAQLGHSTPMVTLQTYGAFIPTGADRAYWETEIAKHEAKRRGVEQSVEQPETERGRANG